MRSPVTTLVRNGATVRLACGPNNNKNVNNGRGGWLERRFQHPVADPDQGDVEDFPYVADEDEFQVAP